MPEEVAQVVGCASQSNFSISARSGGHSYGAYGLAGDVVLDLSKLKKFEVATDGTAVIQTGNLLGDVATGLWEHGKRALPHGSCPVSAHHFTEMTERSDRTVVCGDWWPRFTRRLWIL
jgi:FAD/FMN-containing dehydrogenase